MKNLNIVVYTMKGCPFCDDFKKMLTEEDIEFIDRDIHEHESVRLTKIKAEEKLKKSFAF